MLHKETLFFYAKNEKILSKVCFISLHFLWQTSNASRLYRLKLIFGGKICTKFYQVRWATVKCMLKFVIGNIQEECSVHFTLWFDASSAKMQRINQNPIIPLPRTMLENASSKEFHLVIVHTICLGFQVPILEITVCML